MDQVKIRRRIRRRLETGQDQARVYFQGDHGYYRSRRGMIHFRLDKLGRVYFLQ